MHLKSFSYLAVAIAVFAAANASAATRAEAEALPLGTWPSHMACLKNDDGKLTGNREEEIVVTDAPELGNVLTRPYPDDTCVEPPAAQVGQE